MVRNPNRSRPTRTSIDRRDDSGELVLRAACDEVARAD